MAQRSRSKSQSRKMSNDAQILFIPSETDSRVLRKYSSPQTNNDAFYQEINVPEKKRSKIDCIPDTHNSHRDQDVLMTSQGVSSILINRQLDSTYSSLPLYSSSFIVNDNSYETINNPIKKRIKIVCISDTHNGHRAPKFSDRIRAMNGDILIHAGDFSDHGTPAETMDAFHWLCSLDNFKYKIFISGNMDGIGLDDKHSNNRTRKNETLFRNDKNVIYLENSSHTVLGIKIFGCPYTPKFVGGFQYNRRSREAEELWNMIPDDCDILVSHGPPAGILDKSSRGMIVCLLIIYITDKMLLVFF
jgi:hypothetical protein